MSSGNEGIGKRRPPFNGQFPRASRGRLLALVTGGVLAISGIAIGSGGIWLLKLGGTSYYAAAGFGIAVAGCLLIQRRRMALGVWAIVLLGTLIWSLVEVGLDWWPLAARGDLIYPAGLLLLTPWIADHLAAPEGWVEAWAKAGLGAAVAACTVVLLASLLSHPHDLRGQIPLTSLPAAHPLDQPDEDWRAYGRDQSGQRYSPLTQITPANVGRLRVRWRFRTGDLPGPNDPLETTFEVTPIKVGHMLYLCSQHQKLFALDAASGALKWSYDPRVRDNPTFQHLTCRGVSYHEDQSTPVGDIDHFGPDCAKTIFLPVNDGRMIALDALSGKPCQRFGDHGVLDLQEGMGVKTSGFYEPTSPPIVSDKVIVVAGAVTDNYSTHEPSGVIRGFDVRTGKLIWAWDAGAINENQLASPTHNYTGNSPNSWMSASYDPNLGLVYLPMGVATPDIFGGGRTAADERYSSALVALDINTGRRVWSFQTVHHDLWDMDLPSQPTLADLKTVSGVVPVVIQPAKTGDIFVLDRRNGRLVVQANEHPTPNGAVAGDFTSPTQPFSQLSFRPQLRLTSADMWGVTLFDQLFCRLKFQKLRYEGPFTPPSLQGTLVFPGNLGMFEWGGIAVDPYRQIAIANPIAIPYVSQLIPRGSDNPSSPDKAHPAGSEGAIQPMYGTPFGVKLHPLLSPLGIPCSRPPWGYIAGIDLRTMKVVWQHPNGTTRDTLALPVAIKIGVPSLGGPMTTASGVAFLTSTKDDYIRAYNVLNGQQIWQDRLPAGGQSTPMTYAMGGKQYVVTADGGHPAIGSKVGDYVVAYALP